MNENPYEPPAFADHSKVAPPGVLYHYTGQSGLIGIVTNAELWATKIQYMNDATEFGLVLRLAREHLEAIINASAHPAERASAVELLKSLRGVEDINIFAACFCEKGDLLSQWRGYAGGNHGYAIAFDTDALTQIADRVGFILGRCIYDLAVQRTIVEDAIAHCLQQSLAFPMQRRWGFLFVEWDIS